MQIGVIQFPGSNCERETILAIRRAGMKAVEFMWNEPVNRLEQLDGYVIVGGFSYEDRSRAGIIAALDPVIQALKTESEKGKPILGICNGAQILVESGLVPGLENHKLGLALTENKRTLGNLMMGTGYYNAWVHLRLSADYQRNAFTRHLKQTDILSVPVAHAEGRFSITPALLDEIKIQGLNVFQYCNQRGEVLDQFPINPNGSVDNIAAISNKYGNIMAIMPHPERTINGDPLFTSMREYISTDKIGSEIPLYYYPRQEKIHSYETPHHNFECVIELVITDNHALTVQKTLQQLGITALVKRFLHWEIDCADEAVYQQILKTDVLFNPRKERVVQPILKKANFLVRAKEDLVGRQKAQTLTNHFAIAKLNSIKYSLLWQFESENDNIADQILATNIIANPYAHECFDYSISLCTPHTECIALLPHRN